MSKSNLSALQILAQDNLPSNPLDANSIFTSTRLIRCWQMQKIKIISVSGRWKNKPVCHLDSKSCSFIFFLIRSFLIVINIYKQQLWGQRRINSGCLIGIRIDRKGGWIWKKKIRVWLEMVKKKWNWKI